MPLIETALLLEGLCQGLLELLLASEIHLASFGRGRLAPTVGLQVGLCTQTFKAS